MEPASAVPFRHKMPSIFKVAIQSPAMPFSAGLAGGSADYATNPPVPPLAGRRSNKNLKSLNLMNKTLTLFFALLCWLFSIPAFAQYYNLSQADVLTVVRRQFLGRDVDYYVLQDDNQAKWTVFVDAEPMKGWEHECYVFTVPKKTIAPNLNSVMPTSRVRMSAPPSGNYVPLSVKNRYGATSAYKPVVSKGAALNDAETADVAQRTYAIILSGGIRAISNYERYWNDCSFIYQTLVNRYGVPKGNIFPIMSDGNDPGDDMVSLSGALQSQPLDLDGDGVADIKLAATKANVQSTLNSLKNKLNEDDHLFLFVIDHGGGTDDGSDNSYICLWNSESLYDTELANMLTPFCEKYVNVNVVLGQCYSGGFIDDLTKVGCVVSSACSGSEVSYSCQGIPYDEFVYHWTCAVNGADHRGVSVNADADGNGRVTMQEAFEYAKAHDRWSAEHPQYVSTPISVGEDLAFNHLAPAVDLYLKDNPEDTGKEPNLTATKYWLSPSIWVRNDDDQGTEHENPIYTPQHKSCMVYVNVHNRGKKAFGGGQWLHLYWARASTAIGESAWLARELYKDQYVTGGHFEALYIPEIPAGDSVTVGGTWALPKIVTDTADVERHHFCLRAKILPTHIDEKYDAGKFFCDVKGNKSLAQKNISIVEGDALLNGTLVFVRNLENIPKNYTLELVPRTAADEAIYPNVNIDMKLSPTVYSAWERGGFNSTDIVIPESNSNDGEFMTVRCISPQSKLKTVNLAAKEFDVVSLKFDFINRNPLVLPISKKYTFDLIQRDENGEIVGGETFIVKSPGHSLLPIVPVTSPISGGQYLLSADKADFTQMGWIDEQGNRLGNSESVVVAPTHANSKYTVYALTEDGDIATETISLDPICSIRSVAIPAGLGSITVELNGQAPENATVSVTSVMDGSTVLVENVAVGATAVSLDATQLVKGVYAVAYTVDGQVTDQKKININ